MDSKRRRKKLKAQEARGKGQLKNPAPEQSIPSLQQTPLFCLNKIVSKYCLSRCEKNEKAAFADTLHRLSQLTWGEIQNAPKGGMGTEKISRDRLTSARIPSGITDDVQLLAIRFCGNAPMVGYKSERVFHVLFLDRDFTLYDHGS